MSEYDFDVTHEIANEYFHGHVPENRGFAHHSGSENGKNMFSVFYLYFNTDDKVDFHHKMNSLNNILADYDTTGAWRKKHLFLKFVKLKNGQHITCDVNFYWNLSAFR